MNYTVASISLNVHFFAHTIEAKEGETLRLYLDRWCSKSPTKVKALIDFDSVYGNGCRRKRSHVRSSVLFYILSIANRCCISRIKGGVGALAVQEVKARTNLSRLNIGARAWIHPKLHRGSFFLLILSRINRLLIKNARVTRPIHPRQLISPHLL